MSRNVRSLLALVVLTLFLGTGAAHALPPEGQNADRGPGMLVAVWEWVASLFEGAVGGSVPVPPVTTSGHGDGDFGGYIDPNGRD
jgi:hypothetical protein